MMNLFQITSADQSVYYLGQIFGYVGSILPAQNPNLMVGILFKTLNTTALTIGALLVVYVTVVGLLKTAQEGEFLGRQWNSLWVPIRTVLGIAALFPTTTGYSAIQVIIMWVILQGVGAADTLWGKALEYISVAGSPYTAVNSGSLPMIDVQQSMKQLFQGLVCQASAKANYSSLTTPKTITNDTTQTFKYYCGDPIHSSEAFCTNTDTDMLDPINGKQASASSNTYAMGPQGGLCGILTYCDVTKACATPSIPSGETSGGASGGTPGINCLACKAQQSALQSIVPTLGAIASQLVTTDYQYIQFKNFPLTEPTAAPRWIQDYCTANNIPSTQCCGVLPPPLITY